MKSIILLILVFRVTSAFQHQSFQRGSIKNISHSHGVYTDAKNNNDAEGQTTEPNCSAFTDCTPVVATTRQIFLARALLAYTLPLFAGVVPTVSAYTNEVSAPPVGAAIYAYRSGGLPTLRTLGITKLLTRYEGYVEAPKSYIQRQIPISFDFPTDWLQLDKLGGGIQYVDQRNGDKLYVLHATLPDDNSDLKSVNKQWFADVILSPDGDLARSGVVAEGGRIAKSQMIMDCYLTEEDTLPTSCMARRRLVLKYDTVTGSGVQTVERRGLIDAYQVDKDIFMMLTTSNAVKFEQKGSKERETVDNIVNSFKIG